MEKRYLWVNVDVCRQVKMENSSLPVVVRVSKTRLLKLRAERILYLEEGRGGGGLGGASARDAIKLVGVSGEILRPRIFELLKLGNATCSILDEISKIYGFLNHFLFIFKFLFFANLFL